MRASITVLILGSFLQAVFWPVDLVLLILAVRTFAIDDDLNYYLAFGFGLLVALLSNLPLGSLSLIYLLLLVLINLTKKIDFFSYWVLGLPLVLAVLTLGAVIKNLIMGIDFVSGFSWLPWLIQASLILPAYLVVRFWEERFVPRKEIRLKMGR